MNSKIKKTILLVEDEVIIALKEKTDLTSYNYNVIMAHSGREAIETFNGNKNIDLILMDIDLGDELDGTIVAEEILKIKDIPIVFLSNHTEPDIVQKTEKITSYGYVVKNSGITVLDTSIKMAFKLYDAKKESQEKEALLQSIAENYPNAYVAVINTDLKASFLSGQLIKKQNSNESNVLNDIIHNISEDNKQTIKNYYMKTFNGEECSFTIDQSDQTYLFKTVPIDSGSNNINQILSVAENISQRRQTELEQNRIQDQLQQIINSSSDIIWTVDLKGNYTFNNPIIYNILGYQEEEIKNSNAFNLMHPDDISQMEKMFKDSTSEQKGWKNVSIRWKHKNGSIRTFESSASPLFDKKGTLIGFSGIDRDITDRADLEKKLEDQLALFQTVINQSPVPMVIAKPNGELIYNPACAEQLNFEHEPSLQQGMNLFTMKQSWKDYDKDGNLIPVEDLPLAQALQGKATTGLEIKVVWNNDQTERWEIVNATPIYNKEGSLIAAFVAFPDITDLKLAESEIKNQLAEKELLLKELHHRIKNNVASIESLLSIQADSMSHPEAKTAIKEATGRLQSMGILYEKLLSEPKDTNNTAKNYIESLIDSINTTFINTTDFKVIKQIDDFSLNPKKLFPLGIILNELFTNSIKYGMNKGGTTTIEISLTASNNNITLSIKDTGNGFPEDFNIETSKGFGLMVVNILTKQLKGSFNHAYENGSRITITFPKEKKSSSS